MTGTLLIHSLSSLSNMQGSHSWSTPCYIGKLSDRTSLCQSNRLIHCDGCSCEPDNYFLGCPAIMLHVGKGLSTYTAYIMERSACWMSLSWARLHSRSNGCSDMGLYDMMAGAD